MNAPGRTVTRVKLTPTEQLAVTTEDYFRLSVEARSLLTERCAMIIMSETWPGPGWNRLFAEYIKCEVSGRIIVPGPRQAFWTRA